ncbi:unnamed protein product [Amoebophrya sp. A25]|nr:unnamed protein product [Amoebophrya sp. A25]|eukprot:GSA25T00018282001.1
MHMPEPVPADTTTELAATMSQAADLRELAATNQRTRRDLDNLMAKWQDLRIQAIAQAETHRTMKINTLKQEYEEITRNVASGGISADRVRKYELDVEWWPRIFKQEDEVWASVRLYLLNNFAKLQEKWEQYSTSVPVVSPFLVSSTEQIRLSEEQMQRDALIRATTLRSDLGQLRRGMQEEAESNLKKMTDERMGHGYGYQPGTRVYTWWKMVCDDLREGVIRVP